MDVHTLSKSYSVRKLDEKDIDIIFELMHKNDIYFKYHPPFVTKESIADDMKALPPGKDYADKYYVGFFENEVLVANMDLILNYPSEKIAFIGFFMTDIRYQKQGIGSKIIKEVCTCLKSLGYQKVRLGVDRGNPQSHAFWLKNHFKVIEENEYILMELTL